MSDTSRAANMPPSIEAARTANVFRGIAPRLTTAFVVGCGVVVMLIALLLGEQHATKGRCHVEMLATK
jgi:hypothetical protein